MLTLAHFDEFWIIDHSTSSAESATHTGGNRGKGGDLLYRWGNPRAYARGDSSDQRLYFMHNAHWIPAGRPDSGKVLIFNNGQGRRYSSVEIMTLPEISPGDYALNSGLPYGPLASDWIYTSDTLYDFFSKIMSGAQQQKNGNILICNGGYGYGIEVDKSKNIHWHYVSPIVQNSTTVQGTPVTLGGNSLFRFERYPPEFSGFNGKDLSPGDPLETNFDIQDCLNILTSIDVGSPNAETINIFPNPAIDALHIVKQNPIPADFAILNIHGQTILEGNLNQEMRIDISNWSAGIYLVKTKEMGTQKVLVLKN
jgi:hypothetical protein